MFWPKPRLKSTLARSLRERTYVHAFSNPIYIANRNSMFRLSLSGVASRYSFVIAPMTRYLKLKTKTGKNYEILNRTRIELRSLSGLSCWASAPTLAASPLVRQAIMEAGFVLVTGATMISAGVSEKGQLL